MEYHRNQSISRILRRPKKATWSYGKQRKNDILSIISLAGANSFGLARAFDKTNFPTDEHISQLTFICSTSTIKSTQKGVFVINLEHISGLFLVFLLLALNK